MGDILKQGHKDNMALFYTFKKEIIMAVRILNDAKLKSLGFRHRKKSNDYVLGMIIIVCTHNKYYLNGILINTFEDLFMAVYQVGIDQGKKKASEELGKILNSEY